MKLQSEVKIKKILELGKWQNVVEVNHWNLPQDLEDVKILNMLRLGKNHNIVEVKNFNKLGEKLKKSGLKSFKDLKEVRLRRF